MHRSEYDHRDDVRKLEGLVIKLIIRFSKLDTITILCKSFDKLTVNYLAL